MPVVWRRSVISLSLSLASRSAEVPKAIVSLFPDEGASAAELLAHCGKHLPSDQVPVEIEFLSTLPMTPTGKINRSELQARERKAEATE